LIQAEIVRLSAEENNQEEIDALVQESFIITQVILQLTIILSMIQAEIVRLSTEEAA
jgi:predicted double-glycine peptidase